MREAARLRVRGWAAEDIAGQLGVSPRTVVNWAKRRDFKQEVERLHLLADILAAWAVVNPKGHEPLHGTRRRGRPPRR